MDDHPHFGELWGLVGGGWGVVTISYSSHVKTNSNDKRKKERERKKRTPATATRSNAGHHAMLRL